MLAAPRRTHLVAASLATVVLAACDPLGHGPAPPDRAPRRRAPRRAGRARTRPPPSRPPEKRKVTAKPVTVVKPTDDDP
ncbi:MAG: hypothetical protein WKG00_20130 [Polyangiaceae bacterium]